MSWDVMIFKFEGSPPPAKEIGETKMPLLLGTAAEVRAEISAVLPEVKWSEPLYGIFDARGSYLEFNLGDDDPLDSLMISVRGSENPKVLLFALAKANNWTLFDMSTADYLAADA